MLMDDDRDYASCPAFNAEEISAYLLEQRFHLTALEYYAENLERGLEISKLKSFFSNPENFDRSRDTEQLVEGRIRNSPSISTIDSADFSKNSDDGNQIQEEKIKILEFELRKRDNEIQKLRRELTHAVTVHPPLRQEDTANNESTLSSETYAFERHQSNANSQMDSLVTSYQSSPLVLAHERRALNFLIYQYFLQVNMKLTSISFTEEVQDQNVECWDDVGLNIGQPPDLFSIFRAYVNPSRAAASQKSHACPELTPSLVPPVEVSTQTDTTAACLSISPHLAQYSLPTEPTAKLSDVALELDNLKSTNHLLATKVSELERRNLLLINANQELKKAASITFTDCHSVLESQNMSSPTEPLSLDSPNHFRKVESLAIQSDRPPPEGDEDINLDSGRRVCSVFKDALAPRLMTTEVLVKLKNISRSSNAISTANVATMDDFTRILAEVLPELATLLSSSQVHLLFPLLLPVIKLHPDAAIREKLLHLLFHIYPKPCGEEKTLLLYHLRLLAVEMGPGRVENEVLPHIWGEISAFQSRASSQRRQLIAEACGVLAPYVSVAIRGSLLLSVLQQLVESENDGSVLCATVRSLAQLVVCISDTERLHGPLLSLLRACVHADKSIELLSETTRATLLPAVAHWCLHVGVLHTALLDGFLMDVDTLLAMTSAGQGALSVQRCLQSLHIIEDLVPYMYTWVLISAPAYDHKSRTANGEDANSPGVSAVQERYFATLFSPVNILDDRDTYATLRASYEAYCRSGLPLAYSGSAPWPAVQWMASELLPKLGQLLKSLSPQRTVAGRPEKRSSSHYEWDSGAPDTTSQQLCSAVCDILRALMLFLGPQLSEQLLLTWIKKEIFNKSKRNLTEHNYDVLPTGLLAAYLSLLAASNSETDQIELKKSITNLTFLLASADISLYGMRLALFAIRGCYVSPVPAPNSPASRDSLTQVPYPADVQLLELTLSALEPALACASSDEKVCVCGARLLLTLLHRVCVDSSALGQRIEPHQRQAQPQQATHGDRDVTQWASYPSLVRLLESAWTRMDCLWRENGSEYAAHGRVSAFGMPDDDGVGGRMNWPCAVVMLHTVVMLLGKVSSVEWKHKLYSTVQHVMLSILPSDATVMSWSRWSQPQWDCLLVLLQLVMAVGPTAPDHFRDQELLPWMVELVKCNAKNEDLMQRASLARAVVSAVSAVTYYIPDRAIACYVTPLLATLRMQVEQMQTNSAGCGVDTATLLRDVDSFSADLMKRSTMKRVEEAADDSLTGNFLSKLRNSARPHLSGSSATAAAPSGTSGSVKSGFANLFSGLSTHGPHNS